MFETNSSINSQFRSLLKRFKFVKHFLLRNVAITVLVDIPQVLWQSANFDSSISISVVLLEDHIYLGMQGFIHLCFLPFSTDVPLALL